MNDFGIKCDEPPVFRRSCLVLHDDRRGLAGSEQRIRSGEHVLYRPSRYTGKQCDDYGRKRVAACTEVSAHDWTDDTHPIWTHIQIRGDRQLALNERMVQRRLDDDFAVAVLVGERGLGFHRGVLAHGHRIGSLYDDIGRGEARIHVTLDDLFGTPQIGQMIEDSGRFFACRVPSGPTTGGKGS